MNVFFLTFSCAYFDFAPLSRLAMEPLFSAVSRVSYICLSFTLFKIIIDFTLLYNKKRVTLYFNFQG